MSSILKKVGPGIYSRHCGNDLFDVLCILGLCLLVKRRAGARPAGAACAYANDLPIEQTKIVLWTENNSYSGNPKYIAGEILRCGLLGELVWSVDKNILRYKDDFPSAIRLDMVETPETIEDSATAHLWIDDTWRYYLLDNGVTKKKRQIYIQSWRGSYGIKKFGLGRNNYNTDSWGRAWADIRQIDSFERSRGLYYLLAQTSLPIAVNNHQVSENIRHSDPDAYHAKVFCFLKEKGSVDDGHAAERFVNFIQTIILQ